MRKRALSCHAFVVRKRIRKFYPAHTAAERRILDEVEEYDGRNIWPVYQQAREEFDARRITQRRIAQLLVGIGYSLNERVVLGRLRDLAPGRRR